MAFLQSFYVFLSVLTIPHLKLIVNWITSHFSLSITAGGKPKHSSSAKCIFNLKKKYNSYHKKKTINLKFSNLFFSIRLLKSHWRPLWKWSFFNKQEVFTQFIPKATTLSSLKPAPPMGRYLVLWKTLFIKQLWNGSI